MKSVRWKSSIQRSCLLNRLLLSAFRVENWPPAVDGHGKTRSAYDAELRTCRTRREWPSEVTGWVTFGRGPVEIGSRARIAPPHWSRRRDAHARLEFRVAAAESSQRTVTPAAPRETDAPAADTSPYDRGHAASALTLPRSTFHSAFFRSQLPRFRRNVRGYRCSRPLVAIAFERCHRRHRFLPVRDRSRRFGIYARRKYCTFYAAIIFLDIITRERGFICPKKLQHKRSCTRSLPLYTS